MRRPKRQPAWRTAVEGHESDLAGLALIVIALVAGLGIYVDLGGPVGRLLSDLIGGAVGLGRYVVPPALVAAGLALVRDPEVDQRTRLAVSGSVVAVALCGLAHIVRGPDTWPGLTNEWRRGGGIVGAVVGQPLQNLLSPWGAALVLVAVTVAGALVLTQTSLSNAMRATASGVRPGVSALGRWFGSLATLTSDRLNGDGGAGRRNLRLGLHANPDDGNGHKGKEGEKGGAGVEPVRSMPHRMHRRILLSAP